MGLTPAPEICFITDLQTSNIPSPMDGLEYRVEYDQYKVKFCFESGYQNSEFIEENKYILKGLFFNKRWPSQANDFYNDELLRRIIQESPYPRSPKEKSDNLILFLNSMQEYAGQILNSIDRIQPEILSSILYFKNYDEYIFYLFNLFNQGLIDGVDASSKDGNALISIKLTYSGLEYIIDLQEQGRYSKYCFIAMSFSEGLDSIREALKSACSKTGFTPVLIDEVILDSEQTINDGIISWLKRCRFCIADFTEQKDGVYFESGYALGRGLPVIYTCQNDWFAKSHFDTNHFPHITYNDPKELEDSLINRIHAWLDPV